MKWIIKLEDAAADPGLAWVRRFLEPFDLTQLEWTRIDRGRGRYRGVYGRCYFPTQARPHYRISCQVPGPFPFDIVTRKPPLYMQPDGSYPKTPPGCRKGLECHDLRTGRRWRRLVGFSRVESLDEAIVWIIAHEGFHFLRRTRQVPGRNDEIQADAFGDRMLQDFRAKHAKPPAKSWTRALASLFT